MTDDKDRKREIAALLLERHGTTFATEIGIDPLEDKPAPLFRLWCAAILLSARIRSQAAVQASLALFDAGWTTADKLADSTWRQRVDVLNAHGYARYDESTARMLGDSVAMLNDRYGGDLRRLREEANRNPHEERSLLKEFKGLGDVGVNIFFREAQLVWDELYPFADQKAVQTAERLGLAADPLELAKLADDRQAYVRLVAALVRADLAGEIDAIKAAAGTRKWE